MKTDFKDTRELVAYCAEALRPPLRMTVTEAAEKFRRVHIPGSYIGPWRSSITPYMKEFLDLLPSPRYTGAIFVGPAQCGKPLALDTPVRMSTGDWKPLGAIREGDEVWTPSGRTARVLGRSPVFTGQPCYRVVLEDGSSVVADFRHQWGVHVGGPGVNYQVVTTEDLRRAATSGQLGRFYVPATLWHPARRFAAIEPVPSVPTQCIMVDDRRHLFLVGAGLIPTHNTDGILNLLTYTAICDPKDMMLVEKTQEQARDFHVRRLKRLLESTPELRTRLAPGHRSEVMSKIQFRSGMLLTITWPTKNNLSGKPVPLVWLSDYDRMPLDVDGEGSPFDLARKRTTTFGRAAMTVAESSPSFAIEDPHAQPETAHAAPRCKGVLSLYNLGDRRRWYWMCVKCHNAFEPDWTTVRWDDHDDITRAAATARVECPHCGQRYYQDERDGVPGRNEMNRKHARWVPDGQKWIHGKGLVGDPPVSEIASFWLKGPAAAFMTLSQIVEEYLRAERAWQETGDEQKLKAVTNTTLALPYRPKSELGSTRTPEELQARASSDWGVKVVPKGVRFLVAAVDVQKNEFVVQVHGIGSAERGMEDWWVIDRFSIRKSRRKDPDGEHYWVKPHAFHEDWRQLTDEVILKSYPLDDGSGRHMAIKLVVCDSLGLRGVTANAYRFYRWLRFGDAEEDVFVDENGQPIYHWEPGLVGRFHLVRGLTVSGPGTRTRTRQALDRPRVRITYPDAQKKDKFSQARGDVPVALLNSDLLKDDIDQRLARTDIGGRVNFPSWLPRWFYEELTAEYRLDTGVWVKPSKYRNEAWDLMAYTQAALLMPQINLPNIDWSSPPSWAVEWDENSLVFTPEEGQEGFRRRMEDEQEEKTLADLGAALA